MERGSSTTVVEDKKMKGKVLEEPESDSWLDLRLFSGEIGETSKNQVNVLDLFGPDDSPKASQDSNDEDAKKPAEMKQYPCKFCDRKFSSSQALGGHQNAHKKERSDMKREQAIEANPFGIMYPFRAVAAGMAGFPRHAGLYNNKNYQNNILGIKMQSVIQKPSYHHYPNSFHTGSRSYNGREGWPRQANKNSMRENYSFASARRSYPTLDSLLGLRPLSIGASNRGRPLLSELINFVPTRSGAVGRVDFSGAGEPSDRPTEHDLSLKL